MRAPGRGAAAGGARAGGVGGGRGGRGGRRVPRVHAEVPAFVCATPSGKHVWSSVQQRIRHRLDELAVKDRAAELRPRQRRSAAARKLQREADPAAHGKRCSEGQLESNAQADRHLEERVGMLRGLVAVRADQRLAAVLLRHRACGGDVHVRPVDVRVLDNGAHVAELPGQRFAGLCNMLGLGGGASWKPRDVTRCNPCWKAKKPDSTAHVAGIAVGLDELLAGAPHLLDAQRYRKSAAATKGDSVS